MFVIPFNFCIGTESSQAFGTQRPGKSRTSGCPQFIESVSKCQEPHRWRHVVKEQRGRRGPRMRYRGTGGEIASIMSASLCKAKSTKFVPHVFWATGKERCECCGGGEFRLLGSAFRWQAGSPLLLSCARCATSFDIVKDQCGSLYLLNS